MNIAQIRGKRSFNPNVSRPTYSSSGKRVGYQNIKTGQVTSSGGKRFEPIVEGGKTIGYYDTEKGQSISAQEKENREGITREVPSLFQPVFSRGKVSGYVETKTGKQVTEGEKQLAETQATSPTRVSQRSPTKDVVVTGQVPFTARNVLTISPVSEYSPVRSGIQRGIQKAIEWSPYQEDITKLEQEKIRRIEQPLVQDIKRRKSSERTNLAFDTGTETLIQKGISKGLIKEEKGGLVVTDEKLFNTLESRRKESYKRGVKSEIETYRLNTKLEDYNKNYEETRSDINIKATREISGYPFPSTKKGWSRVGATVVTYGAIGVGLSLAPSVVSGGVGAAIGGQIAANPRGFAKSISTEFKAEPFRLGAGVVAGVASGKVVGVGEPYGLKFRTLKVGEEDIKLFGLEYGGGKGLNFAYKTSDKVGFGRPNIVKNILKLSPTEDVKLGSALETSVIVKNIKSFGGGATPRSQEIVPLAQDVIKMTKGKGSAFIDESKLLSSTERLPQQAVRTSLDFAKEKSLKLFGSKSREFQLAQEYEIDGTRFRLSKVPRDIEFVSKNADEIKLKSITGEYVSRIQKLGTIKEKGTKFSLGTAREISDTPFAVEAKVGGRYEKIAEFKGAGGALEGEQVSDYVVGFKKGGKALKTKYGIEATGLSEELRGVSQGILRLRYDQKSKIVDIYPSPKRVKDIGSFSVTARTLEMSHPSKKLKVKIEKIESLFPKNLVREQVKSVLGKPERKLIADFSRSKTRSFGKSLNKVSSSITSSVFVSSKSISKSVSVTPSIYSSRSISPSLSKSLSKSISPSSSLSKSSYRLSSPSLSKSLSKSTSSSSYISAYPSVSPSSFKSNTFTPPPIIPIPSMKWNLGETRGFTQRSKRKYRYTPSLYAIGLNIRTNRKISPTKLFSGLEIRPMVR